MEFPSIKRRILLRFLRWDMQLRRFMRDPATARRVWHKQPLSLILLYGFIMLLARWNLSYPFIPPGYAVTALGVAAAVMAVLGEMEGGEKTAWLLILLGFLLLELHSIKVEHDAQEENQRGARAEQLANFKA
jgi:hypothetical protein